VYALRADLAAAGVPEAEGGNGTAAKFWDWSEEQVKSFA
jgi:retinol dehydrogenase-12